MKETSIQQKVQSEIDRLLKKKRKGNDFKGKSRTFTTETVSESQTGIVKTKEDQACTVNKPLTY